MKNDEFRAKTMITHYDLDKIDELNGLQEEYNELKKQVMKIIKDSKVDDRVAD